MHYQLMIATDSPAAAHQIRARIACGNGIWSVDSAPDGMCLYVLSKGMAGIDALQRLASALQGQAGIAALRLTRDRVA